MTRRNKGRRNFGTINCKECKTEIEKRRKNQEFCSDKCRVKYWMKEHPRVVITLHKEKKGS